MAFSRKREPGRGERALRGSDQREASASRQWVPGHTAFVEEQFQAALLLRSRVC